MAACVHSQRERERKRTDQNPRERERERERERDVSTQPVSTQPVYTQPDMVCGVERRTAKGGRKDLKPGPCEYEGCTEPVYTQPVHSLCTHTACERSLCRQLWDSNSPVMPFGWPVLHSHPSKLKGKLVSCRPEREREGEERGRRGSAVRTCTQ